jgi:hypothetical protein
MSKTLTEVSTRYFFSRIDIAGSLYFIFYIDRYRSTKEGKETRKRGKIGKELEPGSKKTGSGESLSNAFFSVYVENFLVFFIHRRESEYAWSLPRANSMPLFFLYKNIL